MRGINLLKHGDLSPGTNHEKYRILADLDSVLWRSARNCHCSHPPQTKNKNLLRTLVSLCHLFLSPEEFHIKAYFPYEWCNGFVSII